MPLPNVAQAYGLPGDSPARPRDIVVRRAGPFGLPVPAAVATAGAGVPAPDLSVAAREGLVPERQALEHAGPAGQPGHRSRSPPCRRTTVILIDSAYAR